MTRRLIPRVVHRELIASKEADVRCGDDNAIVAKPGKLALKAVPVWTGLVAKQRTEAKDVEAKDMHRSKVEAKDIHRVS